MAGRYSLHRGDAVEWLAGLEDGSVDLVITDPAYESLEKHRAVGTTTRLQSWFEVFPNDRMADLFRELYRVLTADAHLYFLCDAETMFLAKPIGEAAGFRFWKPIVWDKLAIGTGYHYRARCEFVLFFEKGRRPLNDRSTPDVLEAPDPGGPDIIKERRVRGYPTEKPVELLEVLVRQSSAAGEVVADPFMGSGSAGVAAVGKGRHFLGCDLAARALRLAAARLQEAGAEPGQVGQRRRQLLLGC